MTSGSKKEKDWLRVWVEWEKCQIRSCGSIEELGVIRGRCRRMFRLIFGVLRAAT